MKSAARPKYLDGSQWACAFVAILSLHCRNSEAEPMARPASFEVAETVYDSGIKGGWQDWGWGPHELSNAPARINLSQFGGWILHHDSLNTHFGALAFRMLAPSFGNFLQVQLANGKDDTSLPAVEIRSEDARKLPGGWLDVYVPWSELNPSALPFDRIVFHAKTSVSGDWVQFDKVILTRFAAGSVPAAAERGTPVVPTELVRLSVDCRAPGHAISPYIYGVAGDMPDLQVTARRWGGNPTSRYNWQLGTAFNSAKDWYFENVKAPDYRVFLADNRAHNTLSALTVPMLGWVAKDTSSFSFPISKYGPQHAHDPNRSDAGDGVRPDGISIRPGPPTTTSVAAPPEMIRKWVETIRGEDQKTQSRSVQVYILDNEPSLWNATHRDVHPDPLSYDELLDRTIRYGSAVRAADPQALIAGPAEWGWTGYFYSAMDTAVSTTARPDRRAHGDVPLLPWYLKKLREHDQATGTKVLDVLDVHFYPQEDGVYGEKSDPATAALRIRSTRSLWDSTYRDESWIKDSIRLIPRLKEWVAQNYPGLAISIGEYNFGGEQDISGALALAEALGRFGTGGVDYAFYWFAPPKNSPAYWAFRAYRNFDGKNGQFLSRSMNTRMDGSVSLFASRDEAGKHMVLIALNLDPTKAAQAKIALAGCAPIAKRRRFSYGAGAQSIKDEGESSGADLDETLAPYSINVFDIVLR